MLNRTLLCGISLLAACVAPTEDRAGDPADPVTGTATAYSFAYAPMGFARITAAGAITLADSVPVAFDSMSSSPAPVTVSHTTGNYQVTFDRLGTTDGGDGEGGHVQVTAEGTTNARCRVLNWFGTTNLTVNVQCNKPDGALSDSPFAVQFFRYVMPAPNSFATEEAYLWRPAGGGSAPYYDYNSSGTHNTVSGSNGSYTVTIPGATAINASMMVTSYGGTGSAAAVCSIGFWGAGFATIECRNAVNQLVDSAFSFSYSTTGPSFEQQGAHAWFDGGAANTTYTAALANFGCFAASATGSRSGSQVTMTVSGALGSQDASPFLRASFTSKYGSAGYCKVETLTASGVASGGFPNSTAITTLRCYDPTGAVIAAPLLTFTHVTSDASGPC